MGNEIIIEKKKFWNGIFIIIFTPIISMFLIISITGIFRQDREMKFEVFFFIILLIISLIGLRPILFGLKKIFSRKPEFKITDKELIIYDNPSVDSILLTEISDLDVYRHRHSRFLKVSLKPDSKIEGNQNKVFGYFYGKPNKKDIYIILDFADIRADDLIKILKDRI